MMICYICAVLCICCIVDVTFNEVLLLSASLSKDVVLLSASLSSDVVITQRFALQRCHYYLTLRSPVMSFYLALRFQAMSFYLALRFPAMSFYLALRFPAMSFITQRFASQRCRLLSASLPRCRFITQRFASLQCRLLTQRFICSSTSDVVLFLPAIQVCSWSYNLKTEPIL